MPVVGEPGFIFARVLNDDLTPQLGIYRAKILVVGPGVTQFSAEWAISPLTPAATLTLVDDPENAGVNYQFQYVIPPQTQSGVYLWRLEFFNDLNAQIGALDGFEAFTSSAFVKQGNFQPYPYGRILTGTTDYSAIRDRLGFLPQELPDVMIGEPDFVPAAEQWIMERVPDWFLLLNLTPPVAPVMGVVAVTDTPLAVGSWYAALVAKVGATKSLPGPTASQVVSTGQALTVTVPAEPGITSYDYFVGRDPSMLFMQGTAGPGAVVQVQGFAMSGAPLSGAQSAGQQAALKSAVVAVACSFLCSRFNRSAPATVKTMNYTEQFTHDWREEAMQYLADANRYLGMLDTYNLTPAPGMILGRGLPTPSENAYIPGSDPLAEPNPWRH